MCVGIWALLGHSRTTIVIMAPYEPQNWRDVLDRGMVVVSFKTWGLPPASMSLDSPIMMG